MEVHHRWLSVMGCRPDLVGDEQARVPEWLDLPLDRRRAAIAVMEVLLASRTIVLGPGQEQDRVANHHKAP
jgi:hypothetical protein